MSIKTEFVAFIVRILAENTNLVRKPDPFEELVGELITGEPYDQRIAKNVISKTDEVSEIIKKAATRCKHRKHPTD
jgi:hypothetical protein